MEKSRAIKILKPLANSFVDYANITMREEDDNTAEALEMAIEALKAQLSQQGTTKDTTSEQPTIQTEPAIPLSWIEKYIEWLKSLDNEFANLAAAHISVMVKKWREEQDETN